MTEERFLVTGALGCIGAWILRTLLREGIPAAGFDLGTNTARLALILEPDELERIELAPGRRHRPRRRRAGASTTARPRT